MESLIERRKRIEAEKRITKLHLGIFGTACSNYAWDQFSWQVMSMRMPFVWDLFSFRFTNWNYIKMCSQNCAEDKSVLALNCKWKCNWSELAWLNPSSQLDSAETCEITEGCERGESLRKSWGEENNRKPPCCCLHKENVTCDDSLPSVRLGTCLWTLLR